MELITRIKEYDDGFVVEVLHGTNWQPVSLTVNEKPQSIFHETKEEAMAVEIAFLEDAKKGTVHQVHPVKRCKGCNAQIIWLPTTKGKSIPVDPKQQTIVTQATTKLMDEAFGLIKDALEMLDDANFFTGPTVHGIDEGWVRAAGRIEDMKDKFSKLRDKAGNYNVVTGYVPHWATCPAARKFKKRDPINAYQKSKQDFEKYITQGV